MKELVINKKNEGRDIDKDRSGICSKIETTKVLYIRTCVLIILQIELAVCTFNKYILDIHLCYSVHIVTMKLIIIPCKIKLDKIDQYNLNV